MKVIKLDISKGLTDAFGHVKGLIKPLALVMLINILTTAIQFISNPSYKMFLSGDIDAYSPVSPTILSVLMSILLWLIGMTISNMIILLTKNRILDIKEDFNTMLSFAFKKVFVVIGSVLFSMLPIIPAVIILVILAAFAPIIGIVGLLIFMIVGYIYSFMLVMIQYSIIVDDAGPIESWKNSIKLVKHNFFRLLLVFIVLFALVAIVMFSMVKFPVVIIIVMVLLQLTAGLFYPVFLTTLYAQTITDEPEIEFFDLKFEDQYE